MPPPHPRVPLLLDFLCLLETQSLISVQLKNRTLKTKNKIVKKQKPNRKPKISARHRNASWEKLDSRQAQQGMEDN